jgi:ParB/RepB/Spo0J family partition protein
MKSDNVLMNIPLEKIQGNTQNPRRIGNSHADNELIESIRYNGILMPILVRPAGAHFAVVAGERRLQAAKLIGLETIPALVRSMDDEDAYEAASAENLARADMNPADECEAVRRMVQNSTRKEVATRFGRSIKWVASREKVASMGEEILQALRDGDLPMAGALSLCELSTDAANAILPRCLGCDAEYIARIVSWQLRDLCDADWGMNQKLKDANGNHLPTCAWCVDRTDKQVDLFGAPTDSKARCTNEICWHKKKAAVFAAEQKKREKEAKSQEEVEDGEPCAWPPAEESDWLIERRQLQERKKNLMEAAKAIPLTDIPSILSMAPGIAEALRLQSYNSELQQLADDDGVTALHDAFSGPRLWRAIMLTTLSELYDDDEAKAIGFCNENGIEIKEAAVC